MSNFFSAILWQEQVSFLRNDDDVRFVLDQQALSQNSVLLVH